MRHLGAKRHLGIFFETLRDKKTFRDAFETLRDNKTFRDAF